MMYKNDYRNRFNGFKSNNIDSNGFQKLYELLTKKNKDENEKKNMYNRISKYMA